MSKYSRKELEEELREFKYEKERVREIVGQIGGKKSQKLNTTINIVFLVVVLFVFSLGTIFHMIDYTISLEIGLLLLSLKIAWMIRKQEKVNHFQFWVLTSLEFRQNEISKKINSLDNIFKGTCYKYGKNSKNKI